MSHRWYPEDGSTAAWLIAVAAGLFALVGPVGFVRWWRGYGEQGRRLRIDEPRRFALMAHGGHALIPLSLGLFSLASGLLCLNLEANTGRPIFETLSAALFLLFLICGFWAVKEFVRASPWMPRPQWVEVYKRQASQSPRD